MPKSKANSAMVSKFDNNLVCNGQILLPLEVLARVQWPSYDSTTSVDMSRGAFTDQFCDKVGEKLPRVQWPITVS